MRTPAQYLLLWIYTCICDSGTSWFPGQNQHPCGTGLKRKKSVNVLDLLGLLTTVTIKMVQPTACPDTEPAVDLEWFNFHNSFFS